MLPILINCKVIYYSLTSWMFLLPMIISIHISDITYSPNYPSVETDDMHITIDNGSNNTVEGNLLLCSSSYKQIFRVPHWYGKLCSSQCQIWAGVSRDINKSFECVSITDSFLIEYWCEWHILKLGSNMTWTIVFFTCIGANENFLTSILKTAFWVLNCVFQYLYHLKSQ